MLNTVAASKETENKAAIKKKAAQTNADQIKNSDDGIDAREAAEQKMKQDEDDAPEVVEKTCKVKQEDEQLLEEAEKELERLKAVLAEKRTAYGNEKAAAGVSGSSARTD
jgi:nucleotidyltransferase/DNA polymerase involved in DNA repair